MPPRPKTALLPPEFRSWLHQAIIDRAFGDIQGLTDELNALCKAGNVAISFGKSAIGVEVQRVRRAQEAIKATTEATRLIAEASRDDTDSRSEAVMALVQSEVFELLMQVRELGDEADPLERLKALRGVGKTVAELSRARVNQAKWRTDVEARARAAADKVAGLAAKGGMSAATVDEIKRAILGIVPRKEQAAA